MKKEAIKKVKKTMMDCPICANKKYEKTFITCASCSFMCCNSCTEKYLTSSGKLEPDCMNCKKKWDYEFVAQHTPNSFHNRKYREYRTKILLEREKSLLPDTQPMALEQKNKTQLKEQINHWRRVRKLRDDKLKEAQSLLNIAKYNIDYLNTLLKKNVWDSEYNYEKKTKIKNIYHAKCPKTDCKGYVGDNWECGLCSSKVCKKCHNEILKGHVCDKDDIKTAILLKKDTKNCPTCKVPIHKIEGCDQIFCVQCHTAFSWKTGKIETGRIHNPHYYEFLQNNNGYVPREDGDIVCGGLPGMMAIAELLTEFLMESPTEPIMEFQYPNAHRLVVHITDIVLAEENKRNENTYSDLRVKFLLGQIDEKKWKRDLKRREKKLEKQNSINLVLKMFVDVMSDMFRELLVKKDLVGIWERMLALREYVNNCLVKIGKRFNNKTLKITEKWDLI